MKHNTAQLLNQSVLERFVTAQDAVIKQVFAELAAGCKTTHWMWFVFPQLRCLGRSEYAVYFGIEDLKEARAYLTHPILRERMTECLEVLSHLENRTALQIFGKVDARKLQSCLTLFEIAEGKIIRYLVSYLINISLASAIEEQ